MSRVGEKRKREAEEDKIELSENSWMEVSKRAVECTKEDFDNFWAECPVTKEKVTLFGKTSDCPRFQKLYGKDVTYNFSTITLQGDPEMPDMVQRCMKYAKEKYPEFPWRAALVNFYKDGTDYIAAHGDDERELVNGAPILSFSFGAERTFRIRYKDTKKVKVDLKTSEGSMIAMCGDMQKQFLHEIPRINGNKGRSVGRRINVTVRCFK